MNRTWWSVSRERGGQGRRRRMGRAEIWKHIVSRYFCTFLSQSPCCIMKSLSCCNLSQASLKELSNMKKVKRTFLLHCSWAGTMEDSRVPRKQPWLDLTWCLEIWSLISVHSLVSNHQPSLQWKGQQFNLMLCPQGIFTNCCWTT